ncbi:MAG: hypothetical protein Ta2F_18600 [Termitinemataceae bacterium]|nr:MAG: hypothetical protein Ta2F_18600 [Termitinemataceae bacterium]
METTIQQPQMGLTFEQVWAALMENRESQKRTDEQMKKTEECIEKMSKKVDETSAQIKETSEQMKKTDEQIKRMSKNLGGIGESLGELIETLIAARLWEKFDAYPYNLKRAYQRVPLYDENSNILTDIDILLSNGEYVMGVEVKREFDKKKEVDHHLKRMELIQKYPPAECKGKKLLGAIAGGTVDPDVAAYAHSVGFFVLELSGESVRLAKTPAGFIAGQW